MNAYILRMVQSSAQISGCLDLHGALKDDLISTPQERDEILCERFNHDRPYEKVVLSQNNLETVPSCVFRLNHVSLRTLDLSWNRLRVLNGDSIGRFACMTRLSLSRNALARLPNIGTLTSLEALDVSFNPLKSLPTLPRSLKHLSANDCHLTSLPKCVVSLSMLVVLNVRRNRIERLPAGLSGAKGLKVLDVAYNVIDRLPMDIVQLINLETLDVSNNLLATIPTEWVPRNEYYIQRNPIRAYLHDAHSFWKLPRNMRRSDFPDRAIDRTKSGLGPVYIGSEQAVTSKWCSAFLEKAHITHVLSVMNDLPNPLSVPSSVVTCHVDVRDVETASIDWDRTNQFIHNARRCGGGCLVHCHKGVSRSASCVLAYMLWLRARLARETNGSWDPERELEEALVGLKRRRCVVNPNNGFKKKLLKFATELSIERI